MKLSPHFDKYSLITPVLVAYALFENSGKLILAIEKMIHFFLPAAIVLCVLHYFEYREETTENKLTAYKFTASSFIYLLNLSFGATILFFLISPYLEQFTKWLYNTIINDQSQCISGILNFLSNLCITGLAIILAYFVYRKFVSKLSSLRKYYENE